MQHLITNVGVPVPNLVLLQRQVDVMQLSMFTSSTQAIRQQLC
jgi:hypothetical protein